MKQLLTDYPLNIIMLFALALVAFEVAVIGAVVSKPGYELQTQVRRYKLAAVGLHLGVLTFCASWACLGSPAQLYHDAQGLNAPFSYMYEALVAAALCAPALFVLVAMLIYVFPARYAKYDSDCNPVTTAQVRSRRRPKEYLFS
jgi:hypothetical protein